MRFKVRRKGTWRTKWRIYVGRYKAVRVNDIFFAPSPAKKQISIKFEYPSEYVSLQRSSTERNGHLNGVREQPVNTKQSV